MHGRCVCTHSDRVLCAVLGGQFDDLFECVQWTCGAAGFDDDALIAHFKGDKGSSSEKYDSVLVAVGRIPEET